ncbi:MAG: hypothetical protein RM021_030890 [Nostoc sp. EkiNYC01]|nr:hypothetical protein [Nostoc sp. EkiNYC01]
MILEVRSLFGLDGNWKCDRCWVLMGIISAIAVWVGWELEVRSLSFRFW